MAALKGAGALVNEIRLTMCPTSSASVGMRFVAARAASALLFRAPA